MSVLVATPTDYDITRDLTLIGHDRAADVTAAVLEATVNRTIDGASTLSLSIADHRRVLLRSGVIDDRLWAVVDGLHYDMVAPGKQTNTLGLEFEDSVVAALRRQDGPKKWEAGTTSRGGLLRDLAREAGIGAAIDPALDARSLTKEINRSKDGQEKTNSWAMAGSVTSDVAARRFSDGTQLVAGFDDWLIKRFPTLKLTEPVPGPDGRVRPNAAGVVNIDFAIDYGQKSNSATLTVDADRWATPVGQAVELSEMGPANGIWLVTSAPRTLGRNRMSVTVNRLTPALAEPKDADGGEFDFLPGFGAGEANGAGGTTALNPRAIDGSARQQFVTSAQRRALGKPYVWGASGPNGYDCSGLVQASANDAGKPLAKPALAQWQRCLREGRTCSVEDALKTPGALLFRIGSDRTGEATNHVAISLGGDRTVEAKGKAYGCGEFGGASKRKWTGGALWV